MFHDKKIRNAFIKFMIDNNVYYRFIYACETDGRRNRDLAHNLFSRPDNVFNGMLSWSDTREGWNYWANVSVLWKEYCLQLGFAHSINWFEKRGDEFVKIDIKYY